MNNHSQKFGSQCSKAVRNVTHFVTYIVAKLFQISAILATILIVILFSYWIHHVLSWEWVKPLPDTIARWTSNLEWTGYLWHRLLQPIFVWTPIQKLTEHLAKNATVIYDIGQLFAGLGLFTFLAKREDFICPLRNIFGKDNKFNWGRLRYEMDKRKSLAETWRYYVKAIWLSSVYALSSSPRLLYATSIVAISCLFVSSPAIRVVKTSIKETVNHWVEKNMTHVIIADVSDPAKKQTMSDLIKGANKYSLVYQVGKLEDRTGVCPEGSNLEWLNLFRSALSDTPDITDRRTRLIASGFASLEPVAVNESIVNAITDSIVQSSASGGREREILSNVVDGGERILMD